MTAVELLKKDLDAEIKLGTKMVVNWDMYLEMEKHQIIDAYWGGLNGSINDYSESKQVGSEIIDIKYGKGADQYYTSTYGSKGSDDHIVDTNEMVDKSEKPILIHGEHQIQMLEISDEQIRSAANNVKYQTAFYSFIEGAKWYREQLKQRQ